MTTPAATLTSPDAAAAAEDAWSFCPMCGAASLDKTSETFDLGDILGRWQKEDKVEITESVWRDYTRPDRRSVTLHRCANCAFAVFLPVLPGTPDFYKCITTEDGSCYIAAEDKWEFLQAVKDLRRHGARRVLDVGSGSGNFLDLVRERLPGVSAAGFEHNEEMVRMIRAKGHEVYTVESPEEIPRGEGGFDAVCIFQVLEHVADPRGLLETAHGLLRPGGLLVIAVPDNAGPVRHFSNALTELPPHHLSRWRASTFRLGLPRLGFEVLRVAFEPLHAGMWDDYLPVILEHSKLPRPLARALNKNRRLARLLGRLGFRWIHGVRGHSVYVVARKAESG